MDLLITTFGSRIRRRHDQIIVEIPDEKKPRAYPARRLERILIMGSSSISSDAVQLAMKHGVDISYIGQFGKPEARIVPAAPSGFTKVRHAQFRAALTGGSFAYARQFVLGKIKNQIAVAIALGRDRDALARMREALARAELATDIGSLMSAEGFAAERYFSGAWSHVFKETGRDQRGIDPVNAALNYGYGILYNEAERALLIAGLDPYVGMLHSERYGKPSLTLDFVEEFRVAVVDTAVLPLFANGLIAPRDFIPMDGKQTLSAHGRRKVVSRVFSRLHASIFWKGQEKEIATILTEQARLLARSLLQQGMLMYEAFTALPTFYEKSLVPDRRVVEKS